MTYGNIREEELKNKVAQDFFGTFDCSKIIGNIDFCVTIDAPNKIQGKLFETESLLWAEAKKGKSGIFNSLVQLILTIGKARTFDKILPPAFLGAFDGEKIAFLPYNGIHDIFYVNDFNWNVTPSNHNTKEFQQVYDKVKTIIEQNSLQFNFASDSWELQEFIRNNFVVGKSTTSKIKIDKNNFMVIYNKWLSLVKPTIAVNWEVAKKVGIIDGDFYLADLLSEENETLKEKLYVLLRTDHYELDRKIDELGMFNARTTTFTDKQATHRRFWNKYIRPPKEEYWDYIVERRDLLVPQDVRERKGSFFTPQIWVELSQKYLTNVLGEDWQDEYYIWDCAAGTGNLLHGLTNKYNIWASTLDNQDVEVMHDRIKNGANLLDDHVFQFDFLNDEFDKLPRRLQEIINDPEKREKLVIYINPPYAEAGSTKQKKAKTGVSNENRIHKKYFSILTAFAKREIYVQFLTRIYTEIPDCRIAIFSKLKNLQSTYFSKFRDLFRAKLERLFLVPADTFDNVKGKFPIGFSIWNTRENELFRFFEADVYGNDGQFFGNKNIYSYDNERFLNDWLRPTWINTDEIVIGYLACNGNDFGNQNGIFIEVVRKNNTSTYFKPIKKSNLIRSAIYFSVRHCIQATWLNDRDQFLYPNDGWKTDYRFQTNCLVFTLFNNDIQSKDGINHWIPFTEQEVDAREKFESNFMSKVINGKTKVTENGDLFENEGTLVFSQEASDVLNAGRALWSYYHRQPGGNVNASLYDIREHFQGINEDGKMNSRSSDKTYMDLIGALRGNLRLLADQLVPKAYEFEFLKL